MTPEDSKAVAELVHRYHLAAARKKNAEADLEDLKTKILSVHGAGVIEGENGESLEIRSVHRTQLSLLEQHFPHDTHPELYQFAVNTDAVKRRLSARDRESVQVVNLYLYPRVNTRRRK